MKNQLMKVKQVSQMLNVSDCHTYKLIRSGVIPAVRIGKNIRVVPQDLNNYINSHKSGLKDHPQKAKLALAGDKGIPINQLIKEK